MHAGRLDRRITLLARTVSGRTAYGAPAETWTVLDTVSAMVRQSTGSEADRAERTVGMAPAEFTIRHRRDLDINAGVRVRYDNREYDITSVAMSDARQDRMVLVGTTERV